MLALNSGKIVFRLRKQQIAPIITENLAHDAPTVLFASRPSSPTVLKSESNPFETKKLSHAMSHVGIPLCDRSGQGQLATFNEARSHGMRPQSACRPPGTLAGLVAKFRRLRLPLRTRPSAALYAPQNAFRRCDPE